MHILTKPSETEGKEYILTDGCDGKGKEIFTLIKNSHDSA